MLKSLPANTTLVKPLVTRMLSHVYGEIIFLSKLQVAFIAFKIRVNLHVLLKDKLSIAFKSAFFTFETIFVLVRFHVNFQVASRTASIHTLTACKRSLARVNSVMNSEATFGFAFIFAQIALEWLLAHMH